MADEAHIVPTKGSVDYLDYVLELAKGPTLMQGVINEPRLLYDHISINPDVTVETAGTPDAIYNRELFPYRLTHMTAAIGWDFVVGAFPNFIQLVGLQLRYHDQFYMNDKVVAVPAWQNKVVAAPDVVSSAVSSWDFIAAAGRPPILAKQDTFFVQVRCDDPSPAFVTTDTPLNVTVTFTGIGLLSKRPYLLSGSVALTSVGIITTIPGANFRNDGNEPIIITDMSVLCGNQNFAPDVFVPGDIRRISVNVKQVGSGTGSWWLQGPPGDSLCPAVLLGLTTGRAVVHQFPGVGQLFGPADGITYITQRLPTGLAFQPGNNIPFVIGFAGYIMVT